MGKVLIIDDEIAVCDALAELLTHLGHEVEMAMLLKKGIKKAKISHFDVILLDVSLPDGNGLEALSKLKQSSKDPEIIIMTGFGDPDSAEFAVRNGAWDYLEKKSSVQNIIFSIDRAIQYRKEKSEIIPAASLKRERIIGNSAMMRPCFDLLAQAAICDANVLITGDTGTGKELFSRAIHSNSPRAEKLSPLGTVRANNPRADKNFVVVDCTALPETLVESVLFGHVKGAFTGADRPQEGLIEQADGGTLFLDEVGELPLITQKAFLRVLQERRFRPVGGKKEKDSNFRLIAATNRDLEKMQKKGEFRKDLLFRIRALSIELPPLRSRPEDIKDLARHHMARLCQCYDMEPKGFSPELFEAFLNYDWPGNVRELVNTIDGMLAVAGNESMLYAKHLPLHIRVKVLCDSFKKNNERQDNANFETSAPVARHPASLPSFKEYRNSMEKKYLQDLISLSAYNIPNACKISNISRSRLYELLTKYGISSSSRGHGSGA